MSAADARGSSPGAGRGRALVRWVSACLLLLGIGFYLQGRLLRPFLIRVPLRPLVVSHEHRMASSLPAKPGSLAGQSVLLVTLDSVRPDRIGAYGNRAIRTPNLDRLAREGVLFSKAVATASSTLPAHGSILTGLYPRRHGGAANGLFRVGDEVRTLAEILSESGYDTAAFVSSFVLDAQFGLDQGFDVYDDRADRTSAPFTYTERRGDETTERAIRWLGERGERPFFLWVHYYDPHARYEPPQPFFDAYPLRYDGEIAFVDWALGRLLAAAEAAGGPELLVAVVADHGEALGERGEDTHSYLVQEATLRIPLILYARNRLPAGVNVDTRVSQIDLVPTILPLLGLDTPDSLDGVDLAGTVDPNRLVMAETIEGRVNFGWARISALYRGPLKLVDGPHPELYDLSADPLARSNLADARSDDAMRLQRELDRLRSNLRTDPLVPSHRPSRAELEQLAALGYIVTGDGAIAMERDDYGPDPLEMTPLLSRLLVWIDTGSVVESLSLRLRLEAALDGVLLPWSADDVIEKIEGMTAEHPEFTPAYRYLIELYKQQNRPGPARRARERMERILEAQR